MPMPLILRSRSGRSGLSDAIRLNRLEQQLLARPRHEARPGVQVKSLPQDGELYLFAPSADRVAKRRAQKHPLDL
jgi:hypothetical protein